MNLMPYDELNTFREMATRYVNEPLTQSEKEQLRDDMWEYIEFLLIEAYVYGNVQAMDDLGMLDRDPKDFISEDEMQRVINEPVAKKTYKDRIREYLNDESSTVEDFVRVAETDATRVYNAGVVDGGKASGVPGVMKQWITMEDERVRSTHEYLQSMTVPLDQDFFTYDGDHARAPGLFTLPENNINCRCTLTLIRE
jgi:hypothetical protein